jgi:Tfp pilus assembly protein PilO
VAEKKPSFVDQKIKPALEKAIGWFNGRKTSEKVMFVILAAVIIIAIDYWILIRPVMKTFSETLPQIGTLESKLHELKSDQKNVKKIDEDWLNQNKILEQKEKMFIAPNELPALLENLSKLASDSGVKIISLNPIETTTVSPSGRYGLIPIKISGVAATHELGKFLSKLEGGNVYFRVVELNISENPVDLRRHLVNIQIETYRTSGSKT